MHSPAAATELLTPTAVVSAWILRLDQEQNDSYCSVLSRMKMKSMPLGREGFCVLSSKSGPASSAVTYSYHYRAEAGKIKTSAMKRLRRIGKNWLLFQLCSQSQTHLAF